MAQLFAQVHGSKRFHHNQHYLEHLPAVAKEFNLSQISCYSLERRIRGLKTKINSTQKPEVNAANILISTANANFHSRSKALCVIEEVNQIDTAFKNIANLNDFSNYNLKKLLADVINVSTQGIEPTIKYANGIAIKKKVFYHSSLHPGNRKTRTCTNALVKSERGNEPCIAKTLLLFKHQQSSHDLPKYFVLIQLYSQISVSLAGIPFCDGNQHVNMNDLYANTLLKVVPVDALISPVATLKSNCALKEYNNRIYFFWPQMQRANMQIGQAVSAFNFEDAIFNF